MDIIQERHLFRDPARFMMWIEHNDLVWMMPVAECDQKGNIKIPIW